MKKKIYGWLAASATITRASKLKGSTHEQGRSLRYSIPAKTVGRNIFDGARMEAKSKGYPLTGGPQSLLSN